MIFEMHMTILSENYLNSLYKISSDNL